MSSESNFANKESPSNEMAPQDDGTKVPLAEDGVPQIKETKYVADPNGDAKIDLGSTPTFSGLTKEELMKYSNDPFWVRLRWFLFILFWVGWVVMLVMAIVIIVQAPGCEPPPELSWIEEKAIIEVDTSSLPTDKELLANGKELGISSFYFPNLINETDFDVGNYDAEKLIMSLSDAGKHIVTDLPTRVLIINNLYKNASQFLLEDATFNYEKQDLANFIMKNILSPWIAKGVKGFLMELMNTEPAIKFTEKLNSLLEKEGGAIGGNVKDVQKSLSGFSVSDFTDFLENDSGNWTFYKFEPAYHANSFTTANELRLMTTALFLYRGTPILQKAADVNGTTSELIEELSVLRENDGFKFGKTDFINSTSYTMIGFTRVHKGTPAYAVALNFNNSNETISFKGTSNIAKSGTVELLSTPDKVSTNKMRVDLMEVPIGPWEAIAIQFVADYSSE